MRTTVREGAALEKCAHSVHIRLDGLEPGRENWYRFTLDTCETVVGRTFTASRDSRAVRLAVAGLVTAQARAGGAQNIPIIDTHIHLFDPNRPQEVPYAASPNYLYSAWTVDFVYGEGRDESKLWFLWLNHLPCSASTVHICCTSLRRVRRYRSKPS